jgi:uncharacterized membrane protein
LHVPQRVESSIEIDAPIEIVYRYWETLENLPNFMDNVKEVAPTGTDTTHWKVKGPFGRVLDWEARTTQKEPNSIIAWTTIDGEAGTSGQVRFREAGEEQTCVEVQMNYADSPGGEVGEVASRIVANPRLQLEKDLRNLKDILEGRTIPEEVQQRPAATTIQSSPAAFLAAVTLLVGAAVLAFFLLGRREGSRGAAPPGRLILLLEGRRGQDRRSSHGGRRALGLRRSHRRSRIPQWVL